MTNPDSPIDFGGVPVGSKVGKYLIEEQIGRGGMAAVYRARDEQLDRVVALKVLAPALAADEGFRQRFVRESRVAASVDDPHIIPLYEAGQDGSVLFIAMRYVSGGDVRSQLFRQGSLTPEQTASIVSQVASALDAAHAAGLVHRDVKPANMLLDSAPGRSDHVYLSDFGLSKEAAGSIGLTGTGLFLGTVDYAAPEQIDGRSVDGRTDQYALGCATFEMLSGAPPFRRDHGMAVLAAHLNQQPPSLVAARPDLPPGLDSVFAKVLAKSADDRYQSCGEFADALREVLGLGRFDYGAPRPAHQHTELAWNAYPASPSAPAPPAPSGPGSAPVAGNDALTGAAHHIVPGFSQPPYPGPGAWPGPGPGTGPGSQPPYPGPPPPYTGPQYAPAGWADTGPQQRSGSSRWIIAVCAGVAAAAVVVAAIILVEGSGPTSSVSSSSGGGTPSVTAPSTTSPSQSTSSSPIPSSTSVISPDNNTPPTQVTPPPASTPPSDSSSAFMQVKVTGEFTVDLPSDFTQMPSIDSDSVELGDASGVKVIVDWTPWSSDAVTHQQTVSQDLVDQHPGYQEISIRSVRYRDYSTAADWLFADDNSAGQPIKSIDRAFLVDSGASFAIELIAPTAEFQTAIDGLWPKVLASFEPQA